MNIFIVYWHPEPRSFNGALLRTAVETLAGSGHSVKISDLHAMRFDPVSGRHNFITAKDPGYFKQQTEELHATEVRGFSVEIENEMEKLGWCDMLILQFPLWWFGLPAVLKGWVDRVFAMGRIYGMGRIYETGVFKGKRAMLSLTTGGPEEAYRKGGFNGDIAAILRPIQRGILKFVGFSVLEPHIVFGPAHLSEAQRADKLERFADRLRGLADESPVEVGSY
jgi:NAD(P)H dehydrogenase (quinone)